MLGIDAIAETKIERTKCQQVNTKALKKCCRSEFSYRAISTCKRIKNAMKRVETITNTVTSITDVVDWLDINQKISKA